MNTTFEIIDFYNGGAQVQVPASTVDMSSTFTATAGGGEPTEIGYEPKHNSALADGAAYDELEHGGKRHLLLKGGHIYDVKVGDTLHVISAEEGHISLPLPADAEIEVSEHDETVAATGELGDLLTLDEKVETIHVSDNFAEEYGVEPGEQPAEELIEALVEKGALVREDDKLSIPEDNDNDGEGDDEDAIDEEE